MFVAWTNLPKQQHRVDQLQPPPRKGMSIWVDMAATTCEERRCRSLTSAACSTPPAESSAAPMYRDRCRISGSDCREVSSAASIAKRLVPTGLTATPASASRTATSSCSGRDGRCERCVRTSVHRLQRCCGHRVLPGAARPEDRSLLCLRMRCCWPRAGCSGPGLSRLHRGR